jgi:hypothetical protein
MKPSHLEPFIDILTKKFGFIISHTEEMPFEIQLIKDEKIILMHWERFTINNLNFNMIYPDTIDQWITMLACFEIIKLPRNYRNDFQKLQSVAKYGNDDCKYWVSQMINYEW